MTALQPLPPTWRRVIDYVALHGPCSLADVRRALRVGNSTLYAMLAAGCLCQDIGPNRRARARSLRLPGGDPGSIFAPDAILLLLNQASEEMSAEE